MNKRREMTMKKKQMSLTKKSVCLFIIISFLLVPLISLADKQDKKILIVYYSRTGKTKLICETLQKNLDAAAFEVKDKEDRSGTLGFLGAAYDVILDRHTTIEPGKIDLSPYSHIIIASPVWNWKLSTPIHTLLETHNFTGKKVFLVTTANIDIKKYEAFGNEAPFVKRFLKDYLRGKKKDSQSFAKGNGGEFLGHYHFATQEKTSEQIVEDALKVIDKIRKQLSS